MDQRKEENLHSDSHMETDDQEEEAEDLTTRSDSRSSKEKSTYSPASSPPRPSSSSDRQQQPEEQGNNSLVGELMSKFGFSDIKEYQEAYRKALVESQTKTMEQQAGLIKARELAAVRLELMSPMAEGPAFTNRMEGWAVVGETEPLATDQRQTRLLLLRLPLFGAGKLITIKKQSCR